MGRTKRPNKKCWRKAKETFDNFKKDKRTRSAVNKYRNLTGSHRSASLTKYRNKNIDGMSDKDLQDAINRMNLERQYRELTKVQFRRGESAVNQMYGAKNAMGRTVKSVKKIVTKGA